MIELTEDLYIAKGAERECYVHPQDDTKVVKIQFNNNINRNQNDLDIYYYNYLKTKNISYLHIAKYYGTIETNKGIGLIFDRIIDYNGSLSKSFEDIITNKILSKTQQGFILDNLSTYLKENMIVFGDVVLSNILCQEYKKDHYRLMIIDGLGARRFGFKLWLHIHSKLFTKFRIYKQWKKLIDNYNKNPNGIAYI